MLVFVDLETSSLSITNASILTSDFLVVGPSLEIIDCKSFKIRPLYWDDDAENASSIHGISKEEAYGFDEYYKSMREMFGWLCSFKDCYMVSHANRLHNVTYDQAILRMHALDNNCYYEFGKAFPERKYISTHSCAKYLNLPTKANLKSLSQYYSLEEFNHHSSIDDVKATYEIFKRMEINIDDFLDWEHYRRKGVIHERDEKPGLGDGKIKTKGSRQKTVHHLSLFRK